MNDNAIKNYAIWARRELMAEVEKRCAWWGISEGAQTNVDSIDGRVLSAQERKQRDDLLRIVRADGYAQLVEKAAYTWFNRLLAIRFMEVNDRLPSHVRMLSSTSGEFEPQCLCEALDLPLDAFDKDAAVKLVQAGDDELLFRLVFLAQCAELAECMPAVFDPVGSAMELLLPTGLLRKDGVVGKLVTDIPEDDWCEGVEIVGWMYQYYVSERKDDVFSSIGGDKKIDSNEIAPATQLFTPKWIVDYLTENSLGRAWLTAHPDSILRKTMQCYVDKPTTGQIIEFRNPEDLTVLDPACGSGHILVAAFDLLAGVYAESGYSNRDAARLLIEKNLIGLEIDPRAAAMASFALTMKACELDGRFLKRGVIPQVVVLQSMSFEQEELCLCKSTFANSRLTEAVLHLGECGSLLRVTEQDIADVDEDISRLRSNQSLFANSACEKLERLREMLYYLARDYTVAIANPPYMGAGNMNSWLSRWIKENYPLCKDDLCYCFCEKMLESAVVYTSIVMKQSWMFDSRPEKMRKKLLLENHLVTLAHLGVGAFDAITGEKTTTAAFCMKRKETDGNGEITRFIDLTGPKNEEGKYNLLKNEIAAPGDYSFEKCCDDFHVIPGCPMAYWAPQSVLNSFNSENKLSSICETRHGLVTGDNDLFMRFWWEVPSSKFGVGPYEEYGKKWVPYSKGGTARRWYGNREYCVNWEYDGRDIKSYTDNRGNTKSSNYNEGYVFKEGITWSDVRSESGMYSARYTPSGSAFDTAGPTLFWPDSSPWKCILAFLNTDTAQYYLNLYNRGLHYTTGSIGSLPVIPFEAHSDQEKVELIAEKNVSISEADWNSCEVSYGFKRHSMV